MNSSTVEALRKVNKAIEAKNAKFNAMPRMKQRVALAREVLNLLQGKKVRATRGIYFEGAFRGDLSDKLPSAGEANLDPALDIEWQRLLPKMTSCKVCMLGVATVASIKLRDNAKISQFGLQFYGAAWGQGECRSVLIDIFTIHELGEMERFFEGGSRGVTARKSFEIFWRHIIKMKGEYNEEVLEEDYLRQVRRQERARKARKRRS